LRRRRRRDVNLNVGLAETPGELDFYDVSEEASEESTFSPGVAERLRERGIEPEIRRVPVTTLAAVCREHRVADVDFLKVDVEGFELEVIAGGDWERYRPRVVVVESTAPGSSTRVGDGVERLLARAGYGPTLFDGLNTFYLRAEDEPLRELLAVPANVNDDFEDAAMVEMRTTLSRAEEHLADARRQARELEELRAEAAAAAERAAAEAEHRAAVQHALDDARIELERLRRHAERARLDAADARRFASDAEIQFVAARTALEGALGDPAATT
jgi:FkbM family methyltransferase